MNKIYFVTFETQKNCKINNMIFHCEAANAAEAKAIAKEAWSHNGMKEHMFHLYAKKSAASSIEYLRVRTWRGDEYKGAAAMNRFLCTDFRTWRVDGRNLYGV